MTSALKLLATLLQLLPAIFTAAINTAHAVEQGFQAVADQTGNSAAKTGAAKASLVEAGIQAIYDAESKLASEVSPSTLTSIFSKISEIVVGAFNTLGWFKKSTSVNSAV